MSQPTILIVDDTPANLRLLAEMLTAQGYRVRPAPNGERALATTRKELPDLILLDIMMPELDGFEVCRRLKADELTHAVPVIFISALNEVFDKVTAFQVGAVDYITKPFQLEEVLARVQTHLSLAALQQELQAQNQELQAFAGTVAHDLKNPLASLAASLSLIKLMLPDALPPDAEEVLQIAVQSAHKMSSIIDELLLLASVRQAEVPTDTVVMGAVVEQAWARLTQLRQQYQPTFEFPSTWPLAQGYAPWLEEVWANYLSNALKYGGRPPHVVVGATPETPPGYVRFWVQDNGPGLEGAAQARLFTEFTRLDQTRAQGHGLGLSIVRRIITRLGGTVGVESQPGMGSVFYFTLPMLYSAPDGGTHFSH